MVDLHAVLGGLSSTGYPRHGLFPIQDAARLEAAILALDKDLTIFCFSKQYHKPDDYTSVVVSYNYSPQKPLPPHSDFVDIKFETGNPGATPFILLFK
ncbi:MAG: hypothetical protein V8S95_13930 [Odoribacter sp.]